MRDHFLSIANNKQVVSQKEVTAITEDNGFLNGKL